ncbi:MAG: TetR/AcrR family transcriptional regulator [Solirubrobacteraceae bacterium]
MQIGVQLFSDHPYNEIWIDEIARVAGISRGLLYHYFPSKRDFYVEAVRTACAQLSAATIADESLPPLEQLHAGIEGYLDYVEHHAEGYKTVHRAGVGADDEVRALIERSQSHQLERILNGITGAQPAPESLRLAVRGWLGFLVATSLDWLDHQQIERDQLRELLVSALRGTVDAAFQTDPSLKRFEPRAQALFSSSAD